MRCPHRWHAVIDRQGNRTKESGVVVTRDSEASCTPTLSQCKLFFYIIFRVLCCSFCGSCSVEGKSMSGCFTRSAGRILIPWYSNLCSCGFRDSGSNTVVFGMFLNWTPHVCSRVRLLRRTSVGKELNPTGSELNRTLAP